MVAAIEVRVRNAFLHKAQRRFMRYLSTQFASVAWARNLKLFNHIFEKNLCQ